MPFYFIAVREIPVGSMLGDSLSLFCNNASAEILLIVESRSQRERRFSKLWVGYFTRRLRERHKSSVLPGARASFLACPRKEAKRRTPRRLGPAGLIAAAISLANGQSRTGPFDATSCRGEPRACVPASPTLRFPAREARRKGTPPSISIVLSVRATRRSSA